jgi:flagellar hook protein FlgE
VTSTTQALDVAINGNGFFQMSNNGAITYSRNGQFQLDKNGNIVDSQGDQLMGYGANAQGVVNSAQTVPLQIPTSNLPPVATTTVTAGLNLNAQATAPATTPFNAADNTSYSYTTSVKTYDSLGGSQTIDMYFVKGATSGQWEVWGGPAGGTTSDLGTMNFNSSGVLTGTTDATTGTNTAVFGQFSLPVTNTDGSANQNIGLNFASTTQFGGQNSVNNMQEDGFGTSSLSNFSIGGDGSITGTYTDGRTAVLGQVVLATFNNPNGLQDLGNNQYAQTNASGVPAISVPGSSNHGSLQGDAVESSNVDLTNSLVDLITAQRNYQANAQTIKTQQTIDQTLINL